MTLGNEIHVPKRRINFFPTGCQNKWNNRISTGFKTSSFRKMASGSGKADLEMYILQGYTFAKLPMPLKQVMLINIFSIYPYQPHLLSDFDFAGFGQLETRMGEGRD